MSIDSLLSISYATHIRTTGFIEFIRSSCFDIGISLVLLDEKVTMNMIIGGLILLLGIRITFYQNTFDKNTTLRRIFLFSTKKKMKNLKVLPSMLMTLYSSTKPILLKQSKNSVA
jgi:hypothetical protein